MKELLKRLLRNTPLYYPVRDIAIARRRRTEMRDWERNGRLAPTPHIVKQSVLKEFAEKYRLRVLVESGTYQGDMIAAMKDHFDLIFSVELDPALYSAAVARFRAFDHIKIFHGDSGIVFGDIVPRLQEPALFWLDGHYSAGITALGDKVTPIFEELHHILSASDMQHYAVIDDARLFGTDPGYPSIEEVVSFVRSKRNDLDVVVKLDSIRLTPRSHT